MDRGIFGSNRTDLTSETYKHCFCLRSEPQLLYNLYDILFFDYDVSVSLILNSYMYTVSRKEALKGNPPIMWPCGRWNEKYRAVAVEHSAWTWNQHCRQDIELDTKMST